MIILILRKILVLQKVIADILILAIFDGRILT